MNAPVILNVDDHEPGRYARTRLLQRAGYRVVEAKSGTEALTTLKVLQPSLVLLDVHLPDIDGLEVCRRIKSTSDLATTAVLQLSASAISPAHRVDGLDNGADGYLIEPVDPEVLLATVRALLRIKTAEGALEQANAALENANAALTQANTSLTRRNEDLQRFAYLASHDLQEPLKTISTFSSLLERRYKGRLDEDADEFLNFICQGAQRMSALIKGLLGYAQIGAKTVEHWETVDTGGIISQVLDNLEQSLAESHASVAHDALPSVRGDSIQLVQLFQNLISNGIKYRCPQQTPVIRVSAEAPKSHMALFSVSDNGMGIAPEYHDQIFAPFQRLHGQEIPGSGIGLATCQRIVEHHGGKIWVESKGKGSGATFRFSLPVT